jgi:hypothetical protein
MSLKKGRCLLQCVSKIFIGLFLMVDDLFVSFAYFMFLFIPLSIISAMAFGIMGMELGIPYESG